MLTAAQLAFPTPELRDYQLQASDRWFSGGPSSLINLPTGLGKTLTSGSIFRRAIEQTNARCLFLAHTDELINQTCRALIRLGIHPNVEKAADYQGGPYLPARHTWEKLFPLGRPEPESMIYDAVWVSSMQTFSRRIEKYANGGFDVLCIDECHRVRCKTYEDIVYRLLQINPAMRMFGLTATPFRLDGRPIGRIFPEFAFKYALHDAIEDGYLVDMVSQKFTMKADASQWEIGATSHGRDITSKSLKKSMNSNECIESIVYPIIEHGEGRKGIVFLPGIEAAEAVSRALNKLRPGMATFIHGKVPTKERRRRIRMYEDGDVQIVTGCNALVEGFDVPDVSLVVQARPTTSVGFLIQSLGRGLRVLSDSIVGCKTKEERLRGIAASAKKDCLVFDFVNNSRFNLVSVTDVVLHGLEPKRRQYVKRQLEKKSQECNEKNDTKRFRADVEMMESLYDLQDALLNHGGPPPRVDYRVEHVNLFGAGGNQKRTDKARQQSPTEKMLKEAYQMMIKQDVAAKLTADQLQHEINRRRQLMCGRSNYGFLMSLGLNPKETPMNWYDANYLRKLIKSRPSGNLPSNWQDLLKLNRQSRIEAS